MSIPNLPTQTPAETASGVNEPASPSRPTASSGPADQAGESHKDLSPVTTGTAWSIGNKSVLLLASLILVVGLGATLVRIVRNYQVPGPFNPDKQGLCDFHNGIYFPARAVLRGQSPYSQAYADENPVARQIPFFSPVILLAHAPLAVMPLTIAEVCNTILQIALLFGIAFLCAEQVGWHRRLDAPMAIAAALILTRGGHITVFNGYFTFQLVLATFLAIVWADKHPIRSAWMLFIVSAKPTYILPLGFLMLARGNVRALVYGAILSIVGAVLSLAWIAYHEGGGDLRTGTGVLMSQIIETQEVHRSMEDESPVFSWTRLDLYAVISKWRGEDPGDLPHLLAMFVFLAFPMLVLFRRRLNQHDDGLTGVTGGVVLSALLMSLYHQSYDSLLMAAPVAGVIAAKSPDWRRLSVPVRWALVAVMTLPAINYFSTRTFLLRFDLPETVVKLCTSVSGISLAVATVMLCWIAWNDRQSPSEPSRS